MATILVIEDEAQERTLFQAVLEEAGYHVLGTDCGKEGLHLLRHHAVDLVLVDIFMPNMDGLEFIQQLRPAGPMPKIIAISGGSGEWNYLDVAKHLGANDTLKKPLGPRELLDAVSAQLKSDNLPSGANGKEGS
jgi:DNA-binding response OmpR family regulator